MSDWPKNVNIHISTKSILKILVAGFLVFALYKLINIVLIILTAIVIASFVEYAVSKTKKFIKNRTLAVFLIYFFTVGIIFGLAYAFLPTFVEEMSTLVESLGKYIPNSSVLNSFQSETISGAKNIITDISRDASIGDLIKSGQKTVESLSGNFLDIFGKAFGGFFNLMLIFIISFYLSIKEKGIENFLRIILPIEKEEYVIGLWQRTEKKIGLWLQGQMLLGLIMGVLTYLGLTLLGVKYSLVLSLLVVILELIPFGIYVAVIPALISSYLNGGVTITILTAILYSVLHQFELYLIYPLIIKKVIGISPLVVILSVIIGWTLIGFWGVVLAIPVAVFLFEMFDDMEKKKMEIKESL